MTYRIEALPLAPFIPFFAMADTELVAVGGRRIVADAPNSAPCRVSLSDAAPGERLILISHDHLTDAASPYRQGGPIFVREAAEPSLPWIDTVPGMISRRLLSVRLFDADDMMIDAHVVEGVDLNARLNHWLTNPAVAQAQIHTARRGCYLARAVREET